MYLASCVRDTHNTLSDSEVVTCGQVDGRTDRHGEAKTRIFPTFVANAPNTIFFQGAYLRR
jgi:hypothetical protein